MHCSGLKEELSLNTYVLELLLKDFIYHWKKLRCLRVNESTAGDGHKSIIISYHFTGEVPSSEPLLTYILGVCWTIPYICDVGNQTLT